MESLAPRDRAGRLPLGQPVGGASRASSAPRTRTVPFWDTQTKNNLYGFQIGADGKLLERGRFSIGGVLKAGIFDNHAEETTTVRIDRIQFGESDSTDHVAFVGEIGVQCKYQVTQRLSLQGRLRSDLAARRCLGARPDPGNVLLTAAIFLRKSTYRRSASIAAPASFITGPPPAWSIRSRGELPNQAGRESAG